MAPASPLPNSRTVVTGGWNPPSNAGMETENRMNQLAAPIVSTGIPQSPIVNAKTIPNVEDPLMTLLSMVPVGSKDSLFSQTHQGNDSKLVHRSSPQEVLNKDDQNADGSEDKTVLDDEDDEDEDDEPLNYERGKRKTIGRPIADARDPNADTSLTEHERKKIKRRIANRESARRVRAKRQEMMEELQRKTDEFMHSNARLAAHAAGLEQQRAVALSQFAILRDRYNSKAQEVLHLNIYVSKLRKALMDRGVDLAAEGLNDMPSLPMEDKNPFQGPMSKGLEGLLHAASLGILSSATGEDHSSFFAQSPHSQLMFPNLI